SPHCVSSRTRASGAPTPGQNSSGRARYPHLGRDRRDHAQHPGRASPRPAAGKAVDPKRGADVSELRTIDQQALLTPDKPALVMAHDGSAVTFAELVERSARTAHLLRLLGLRPGDGIAVLM